MFAISFRCSWVCKVIIWSMKKFCHFAITQKEGGIFLFKSHIDFSIDHQGLTGIASSFIKQIQLASINLLHCKRIIRSSKFWMSKIILVCILRVHNSTIVVEGFQYIPWNMQIFLFWYGCFIFLNKFLWLIYLSISFEVFSQHWGICRFDPVPGTKWSWHIWLTMCNTSHKICMQIYCDLC